MSPQFITQQFSRHSGDVSIYFIITMTNFTLFPGGFQGRDVTAHTSGRFDKAYVGCLQDLVVNKNLSPLSLLHPQGGANVFSCDDRTDKKPKT